MRQSKRITVAEESWISLHQIDQEKFNWNLIDEGNIFDAMRLDENIHKKL